jgi:hypothetical protein
MGASEKLRCMDFSRLIERRINDGRQGLANCVKVRYNRGRRT